MMVDQLAGKMSDAELTEVRTLQQRQHAAADAAYQEADAEVSLEARVTFKKMAGNEAFKEGSWKQAAVYYMEGLSLPTTPIHHILHSNCAACFLKLGRPDKALEHSDKGLELNPEFSKSHFRRGLSLQALERFMDAFTSFETALSLDPKNVQAKSALQLCEVQIQRQRRSQNQ